MVDPVFGMRSKFWRTEGVQHIETELADGGGVPPHIHPAMTETFTVTAGRMEFLSGRQWIEKSAGESVTIEPGTRHAFRNRSGAQATFACEATPPSSLEDFLTTAARMSREGKLTRLGLPKPKGVLDAAVLVDTHWDMVTLLFPAPPRPIQRVLFRPLARLSARRAAGRSSRRTPASGARP